MPALQLKISDLAAIAAKTRFQLHGFLKDVFPEIQRGKKQRSHRTFTAHDLLVITVACEIERKYGVKRGLLADVRKPLRQALSGPRSANRHARLVVTLRPPSATYLEADEPVREGLVIALGPLFARVDEYLGLARTGPSSPQTMLPLSPTVVSRRTTSARAR